VATQWGNKDPDAALTALQSTQGLTDQQRNTLITNLQNQANAQQTRTAPAPVPDTSHPGSYRTSNGVTVITN
jgi:hypothetical protein